MKPSLIVFTILGMFTVQANRCQAQVCKDVVVMLNASANAPAHLVVLSWQPDSAAVSISVARRLAGSASWGANKSVSKTYTTYTDTTIIPGTEYEYRVLRSTKSGTTNLTAVGYIRTGVGVTVSDDPGTCVLVVDTTYAGYLNNELLRLESDLRDEGFMVKRLDVSPNDAVTAIKDNLTSIYFSDPDHISTLFLFGHVPVPYSGFINPDGHPDHFGAWPADVYYGEFDGDWTDDNTDTSTARRPANHNIAGDGKFDQSQLPDDVDMRVGRVDLNNMSAFTLSEKDLLKQYLDKDHAYRIGELNAPERALFDDNFGYFGGEAFASSGWRNFAPLVDRDSLVEADWFTTLSTTPYLFAYGCGGGYDQGASGIGATSDFASKDSRAVFTLLFGSYFGDWNTQNNFLRAPLCSSYGLTCAWSGRPYWDMFPMGMGHTTGETAILTQNNQGSYIANYANYWVHVALMGDPTLRLRPFTSPKLLTLSDNHQTNQVMLSWGPDTGVDGYNVYRAALGGTYYELLTPTAITSDTFTDLHPLVDSAYYLVRGVRSETTHSGNYANLAHGASALSSGGFNSGTDAGRTNIADHISVLYPSASNTISIILQLNDATAITMEIVDIQGRLVATLAHSMLSPGQYIFDWNTNTVSDGLYFVRTSGTLVPLSSKILVRKND